MAEAQIYQDETGLAKRMRWPIGLRLVASYGAVFASSLLLVTVLSLSRVSVLVDQVTQSWGEAIADQLAQTTLDAVMQKDEIALQAHLGRLLKTRGVVSAAVYDVQSALLGQAGALPRELKDRGGLHTFSAMLALGDDAIGRAVVVMDADTIEALHDQLYWILGGGGGLAFVLLIVVSYHFSRQATLLHRQVSDAFIQAMPQEVLPTALIESNGTQRINGEQFLTTLAALQSYVERLQRPSPALLLAAAADLINPADACAYVVFEVRNLDVLQRQVSRERIQTLLQSYQQHIENTCRLYSAQRAPIAGACVKLVFTAKNNPEGAAFQAACCAYVLSGLLRDCVDPDMGIDLQWAMALDWHDASTNELLRNVQRSQDEQRSHWLCEQIGSGQFACSNELAERMSRQDKLVLVETSGTGGRLFYRLGTVSESHRQMLERQIEQLREI